MEGSDCKIRGENWVGLGLGGSDKTDRRLADLLTRRQPLPVAYLHEDPLSGEGSGVSPDKLLGGTVHSRVWEGGHRDNLGKANGTTMTGIANDDHVKTYSSTTESPNILIQWTNMVCGRCGPSQHKLVV